MAKNTTRPVPKGSMPAGRPSTVKAAKPFGGGRPRPTSARAKPPKALGQK